MKKFFLSIFCFVLLTFAVGATGSAGINLHITTERLNDKDVTLTIKAIVQPSAKLYALQGADNDVLFSTISFDSSFHHYLSGATEEKGTKHAEEDSTINGRVHFFTDSVLWQQKI